MGTTILRRLVMLIPVLWFVVTVGFILTRLAPGDPAEALAGQHADADTIQAIRHELGLDRTLLMQYGLYWLNLSKGNLGQSYATRRPVTGMLLERFPATLRLTLAAMFVGVGLGITLGILSALFANTWVDRLSMIGALLGISTPVFWVATMLVLIFAVHLRWLPPSGDGGGTLVFLVLPAIALGTRSVALLARLTRASLLEVLGEDFLRTARAKGLSEWTVVGKHALRNALIPVVTVIGVDTASYLSGVVLTEKVFAWPGIGRLVVDSIGRRDYPVILGAIIFFAVLFVLVNLIVDILYTFIDPRVRVE